MPEIDTTKLIGGPYSPPKVRVGDCLVDHFGQNVKVGGHSSGRIPWPLQKNAGKASFILCGDLVVAIKQESSKSIRYWFGVGESTVWRWRKQLGVDRWTKGTKHLKEITPGGRQSLWPETVGAIAQLRMRVPVLLFEALKDTDFRSELCRLLINFAKRKGL